MQILGDYTINYLDVGLAIPLILGLYKGFKKGLILELTSLLALIVGLFGGIYFFEIGKSFLDSHFDINEKFLPILSFLSLFVCIVLVVSIVGKILDKFVKMIALGGINRLVGALFGLLKMAVIVSTLLMFTYKFHSLIPFLSSEKTNSSMLYRPLRFLVPGILPKLESFDGWDDFVKEGREILSNPPLKSKKESTGKEA